MRSIMGLGLIIVGLLLGCTAKTGAPPPAAVGSPTGGGSALTYSGPTTKVMMGELGSASDSGLFIALEKGYFAEQGIEVERTRFNTAADMVAPLGTGQLDVGGGAP